MGLIHEAKKQGIWPEKEETTEKTSQKIGGIVIESAEGVRFYESHIPLPTTDFPHRLSLERQRIPLPEVKDQTVPELSD